MAGKGGNTAHGVGALVIGSLAILGRFGDDCLRSARHLDDVGLAATSTRHLDGVGSATRAGDDLLAARLVVGDGDGAVKASFLGDVDGLELGLHVVDLGDAALWLAEDDGDTAAWATEAARVPEADWGPESMPDLTGTWCSSLLRAVDGNAVEVFERATISGRDGNGYDFRSEIRTSGPAPFETATAEGFLSVGPRRWVSNTIRFEASGDATPDPSWQAPLTAAGPSERKFKMAMGDVVAAESDRLAVTWDGVVIPAVRCD